MQLSREVWARETDISPQSKDGLEYWGVGEDFQEERVVRIVSKSES